MTAVAEHAARRSWVPVCAVSDLVTGGGVAALLPDDAQAAVFRTVAGEVFALSNVDPFCGAAVLSRGILGDTGGVEFVASPMLKQRFDLRTGECLDAEGVRVPAYPVRVVGDVVQVGVP
ncbi:nitrite reductase (NADH) small subunit [Amycolatopsis arida]|uniref:Nitrite reductase (NADH) small subunit n=1 Tax=Amycolatopsis arida TaxID=587909 RepID=A0A1I5WDD5_9PSEU|nr:nitrite reductase small subunit NirD [Amycolatopsis arida]TDX92227.1 nitrite reductase (NADH) small subunit [Amycolatopsis arida]SFQ17730.1 nitrite reductase (NADH) small subunit [Amycolatopsis arida]